MKIKKPDISTRNNKSSCAVSRNPYINFLKDFREVNKKLPMKEVMREAGRTWRHMPQKEKLPYKRQAANAPKKIRRNKIKKQRKKIGVVNRRKRVGYDRNIPSYIN